MLNLKNKNCLVVGAGPVAFRKVNTLISFTQSIKIVSPEVIDSFQELIYRNNLVYIKREFELTDLIGIDICIASTNSVDLNLKILDECQKRGILSNSVTHPKESHFTFPAFFKTEDLVIAVSTGGKSPLLARKIKEELEQTYPTKYKDILEMLGQIRIQYLNRIPQQKKNEFWEKIIGLLINRGYNWKELSLEIEKEYIN